MTNNISLNVYKTCGLFWLVWPHLMALPLDGLVMIRIEVLWALSVPCLIWWASSLLQDLGLLVSTLELRRPPSEVLFPGCGGIELELLLAGVLHFLWFSLFGNKWVLWYHIDINIHLNGTVLSWNNIHTTSKRFSWRNNIGCL